MNNSQYSGAASIRSDYDLMISDMICKWLQEKYDLKPSESKDLWSEVCAMIENKVQLIQMTRRNIVWSDMQENSHEHLYTTTDSGDLGFLGKIDDKTVEKINEIGESYNLTSEELREVRGNFEDSTDEKEDK